MLSYIELYTDQISGEVPYMLYQCRYLETIQKQSAVFNTEIHSYGLYTKREVMQ